MVQFEAISFCAIDCYLGKEIDPCLATTSLKLVRLVFKHQPELPSTFALSWPLLKVMVMPCTRNVVLDNVS